MNIALKRLRFYEVILIFFFLLIGSFLYFCCSNLVGVWLSLVFSLFSTIYIFKGVESDSSLKYILVQEFSTWSLLLRIIFKNYIFVSLSLIFKIGYPPFHTWFLEVFQKNLKIRNWLLGPRKVIPGFFLIIFFNFSFIFLFFLSIFFSSFLLLGGSSFSRTLVFSRNTNGFFFVLLCLTSLQSALFYFCIYSIFLFFVLDISKNNTNRRWENMASLSGLPPGHIFFLKIISLFSSGEWLIIIIIILFISTFPIFFSYIQLFEKKKLYSHFSFYSSFKRISGVQIIIFTLLFFFIFSS